MIVHSHKAVFFVAIPQISSKISAPSSDWIESGGSEKSAGGDIGRTT